jgi:hypothetical protein
MQSLKSAFCQAVPFGFRNKRAFRMKYLAYVGTGAALPFIAAWWQL